uniref:Uncharacterized protein n=1 Tax=Aegilops tauschii subsp. strangulata TaxID=200361 RepID=A0A453AA22_AEGTS
GQGLLNLSGPGDGIKARQLFLSLFYNIEVRSYYIITYPVFAQLPIQTFNISFSG